MTNFCEFSTIKNERIYRCPDDIKNFKISVTFNAETRYFHWQQKIYSRFERDFYKDEKNCLTDLERKYHQDVIDLVESDGVLFSYTQQDCFIPPDELLSINELSRRISDCRLANELTMTLGSNNDGDVWQRCEVMYIMADLGEYVDDVWIKNEHVLCTINYDSKRKILYMNPDFSTKPYLLEINNADTTKTYQYSIESACDVIDEKLLRKEEELTKKLIAEKLKQRREIVGDYFEKPQKTTIHLFFEIVTAHNFENNNIYIHYYIDLPTNYTCIETSTLTGTTPTSKTTPYHFNFCFDVILQREINVDFDRQRLPYIYFEVVSKDTWSRFRTEGLAYQCLPLFKSGRSEFQLSCIRIRPEGTSGELRRFFIGDCGCYSDVNWVGLPRDYDGNFVNKYGVRTIATGELLVKLNVIQQKSAIDGDESPKSEGDFLLEKFQSANLLKSVADVLNAFKRARKNMIAARKNV